MGPSSSTVGQHTTSWVCGGVMHGHDCRRLIQRRRPVSKASNRSIDSGKSAKFMRGIDAGTMQRLLEWRHKYLRACSDVLLSWAPPPWPCFWGRVRSSLLVVVERPSARKTDAEADEMWETQSNSHLACLNAAICCGTPCLALDHALALDQHTQQHTQRQRGPSARRCFPAKAQSRPSRSEHRGAAAAANPKQQTEKALCLCVCLPPLCLRRTFIRLPGARRQRPQGPGHGRAAARPSSQQERTPSPHLPPPSLTH